MKVRTEPSLSLKAPVAVLGCGLVGSSWVALFLHYGINVQAWDPDQSARDSLNERIKNPMFQLASMAQKPKSPGVLSVHSDMSHAVRGVFFAQENVPEIVEIKNDVFVNFECYAPSTSLIASSTSGLTWSFLSSKMKNPERLLTAHPFNPLHLIPLVEMYCPATETLDLAEKLYLKIGRVPIRLKREATGHIANRLASALWREAVNIVAEGIADVEAVDRALVNGPGLRWAVMGAHMTYHLGGGQGGMENYLRHLGPSQVERWAELGTPILTKEICEALIAGVETQSGGRSFQELEKIRDEVLIKILQFRNEKT